MIVTGLVIFGGIGALAFSISIAVALAGPWFFTDAGEAAAFRQAVLVLGADVALMFPFAVFNAVLAGHYRFDIASAVQLSALAVRTALIVYFISHGYSILALAVITLAVNLPSRLAVAVAARCLLPSLELSLAHFQPDRARELFGYGKYTFIAAAADRLRFQVDTMVVAWFLGVGLVTHYAIAARVTQTFMDLMLRALGVVGPRVHAGRCAGQPRADAADLSAGNPGERPGLGHCRRRHRASSASASSSSGSARLTAMPIGRWSSWPSL